MHRQMSDDGNGHEKPKPAHMDRVQVLRLLVSETCETQVGFISHTILRRGRLTPQTLRRGVSRAGCPTNNTFPLSFISRRREGFET